MSKVFYEVTVGKTCQDWWHPNHGSCFAAILDAARSCLPGTFQFYLPLLIVISFEICLKLQTNIIINCRFHHF